MPHRALYLGLACAAFASAGFATDSIAQVPPQTVRGKIVSVTADEIGVESQGKTLHVRLASDWLIAEVSPASLVDIKPGSFVGTTNVDVADGGLATEVHIFPPGSKLGEGQRVTNDAKSLRMTNGTVKAPVRMTNGTVSAHTQSASGTSNATTRMTNGGVQAVHRENPRESVLELTFAGGTRRVRIPANALITTFTPVERSVLKPGIQVSVRVQPDGNGRLKTHVLTTGPNGNAPAR